MKKDWHKYRKVARDVGTKQMRVKYKWDREGAWTDALARFKSPRG